MNALLNMIANPVSVDIGAKAAAGYQLGRRNKLQDIAIQQHQEDRQRAMGREDIKWGRQDQLMGMQDDVLGALDRGDQQGVSTNTKRLAALDPQTAAMAAKLFDGVEVKDMQRAMYTLYAAGQEEDPKKQVSLIKIALKGLPPGTAAAEIVKAIGEEKDPKKRVAAIADAVDWGRTIELLPAVSQQQGAQALVNRTQRAFSVEEPTDMSKFMSASDEDRELMLQFKRKQAKEAGEIRVATKQVDSDFAQRIKYGEKLGLRLAEIETEAQLSAAKGEITPSDKKANASKRISSTVAKMVSLYQQLDDKGAIINTKRSALENFQAAAGSSMAGQYLQNIVGTEAQSIRNGIVAAQPLLMNYIRQASEMGARGMDSTQELEFYLRAASEPKKDMQSNMAALALLDELYGNGEVADALGDKLNVVEYRKLKKGAAVARASDKNIGTLDMEYLERQFGNASQGAPTTQATVVADMSDAQLMEALNAQ